MKLDRYLGITFRSSRLCYSSTTILTILAEEPYNLSQEKLKWNLAIQIAFYASRKNFCSYTQLLTSLSVIHYGNNQDTLDGIVFLEPLCFKLDSPSTKFRLDNFFYQLQPDDQQHSNIQFRQTQAMTQMDLWQILVEPLADTFRMPTLDGYFSLFSCGRSHLLLLMNFYFPTCGRSHLFFYASIFSF